MLYTLLYSIISETYNRKQNNYFCLFIYCFWGTKFPIKKKKHFYEKTKLSYYRIDFIAYINKV